MTLRRVAAVALFILTVSACGCRHAYVYYRANDIPQTRREGERALETLASRQRSLHRPLVLVYGTRDSPAAWAEFMRWLGLCTDGAREVIVMDAWDARTFASSLELGGREVDVVAHGLGEAAARDAHRRGKLAIVNLYSIAPLRDAENVSPPRWLGAGESRDLIRSRRALAELNGGGVSWDFTVVTYWAMGDSVAGIESADAPPGPEAILSSPGGPAWRPYHRRMLSDPRLISDILRRLFGLPADAE